MVDRGPTPIPASKHPLPVEAKGFRFLAKSIPKKILSALGSIKTSLRAFQSSQQ